MYSFCAMYSFRMSFCSVPARRVQSAPCFFSDSQVHRPQNARRRVDGHRNGGFLEIDSVEKCLHVLKRVDGHTTLAHLAFALGIVRVTPHQRRQIERDGKPASPVRQQVFVALVRLLRAREAGELPHRPQLSAIPAGMNAARVGRLTRQRQVQRLRQVGGRVQPLDWRSGHRREPRLAVLIEIDSAGAADRTLGRFLKRWLKRFPLPALLVGRKIVRGRSLFRLRFSWSLGHTTAHRTSSCSSSPIGWPGGASSDWLALNLVGSFSNVLIFSIADL